MKKIIRRQNFNLISPKKVTSFNNGNVEDLKDLVLKFKPITYKNYESFDLDRLVIYVLFTLNEKGIPLYFDFICVSLFKIFPHKFSLATFNQYPDAFRVNNALRRTTGALSDKNKKQWANGNPENGFYLTDTGREIAIHVKKLLENPKLQKIHQKTDSGRTRGRSPFEDIQEIRISDAFKKWFLEENINNHEFFAFLKAAPYTPKQLLIDHLGKLRLSATTVKDVEVIRFLSWLEKKFNYLLI